MSLIEDQKHVIIIDNSKNRRIYKIQKDAKIWHYKNCIDVNQLIGKKHNSFYQIQDSKIGTLKEITDQKELVKEFFLDITAQNGDNDSEEAEDGPSPSKAQKKEND